MADRSSSHGNPVEAAEDLVANGKPAEAADLLLALLAEGRGGLLARITLARALDAAGRRQEAIDVARDVVGLHPDVAEAALCLGAVLLGAEHIALAIAEFQRALRLDPDCVEARYLVGCAWLEAGEPERALDAFREVAGVDMPGLAARIAEAETMKAQPRSNAGYVRHLFDQFSHDYDGRMLEKLAYRAPQVLRELAQLVMPGRTGLDVLDLGCGTGLSGAAFRDRAERLCGIDLSPAMLDKARARGVYDALSLGDIETGFGTAAFDLVLAADTLVYLGDLEPTMRVVVQALRPDGFFLFTVEAKDGEGYELGPKRRWRHSEAYLRSLAARHDVGLAGLIACVPRHEAGAPVHGFAVALHKPV